MVPARRGRSAIVDVGNAHWLRRSPIWFLRSSCCRCLIVVWSRVDRSLTVVTDGTTTRANGRTEAAAARARARSTLLPAPSRSSVPPAGAVTAKELATSRAIRAARCCRTAAALDGRTIWFAVEGRSLSPGYGRDRVARRLLALAAQTSSVGTVAALWLDIVAGNRVRDELSAEHGRARADPSGRAPRQRRPRRGLQRWLYIPPRW